MPNFLYSDIQAREIIQPQFRLSLKNKDFSELSKYLSHHS